MPKWQLKDARVYIGPYDFSGQHNRIALDLARAPLAAETFVDDTEIKDTGLASAKLSGSGFWEAGAESGSTAKKIDDALFANFTVKDVPVTVVPSIGQGIGGVAYSIQAATVAYKPLIGPHGQLIGFSYEMAPSRSRVIRGRLLALGQWGAADDARFLALVAMQATAYALTSQTLPSGESARCISATHATVAVTDTLGNLVIDGTDVSGAVIQETLALVSDGTAYGVKEFKAVTGLRTAGWVQGGATADTLKVGYGPQGVPTQLGAVSATEKLYGVIHAYAFSGTTPTLDAKIQSDVAAAFPSAVDKITFTQKSGFASEWAELAGPNTDDWVRASLTVAGTATPKFSAIVLAAIAAIPQ